MTPPFLRFGKGFHETQPDRFAFRKDAQEIQEFRDFAEKAILIYVLHRNQLQFANFHFDSFWLSDTSAVYMVADFSEHPKQTFQQECQTQYYGKITLRLHNIVMYSWEDDAWKKRYCHQFCDDKSRDVDFVNRCFLEVMRLVDKGVRRIVFSSDNCKELDLFHERVLLYLTNT